MKSYWKKLETKILFEHPRLTVVEDDVQLPDGKQTKYLRWEGMGDYVTVIAEDNNKVLLISEYSYPHDEWLWQFPEGDMESSEGPEYSAQRELQEETGLSAQTITTIGMNYDHHRRTTRKNYVFSATGLSKVTDIVGDDEEQGIEIEWFTIQQVNDMIREGKIRQKNALAAWSIFLAQTDRI